MADASGEIYYKINCPCGATNWIYAGYFPDPDMSKIDVEGFKCWKCDKICSFIEETEEEAVYINDGKQKP